MISPLSEIQMKVLWAIAFAVNQNGYPPSIRELCELTGAASPTTISKTLKRLERRGYVMLETATARGISLTEIGSEVAHGQTARNR